MPAAASSAVATPGVPVAYKSADVSQMLIVHRGSGPIPEASLTAASAGEDHDKAFHWHSGLTAPTKRIRERQFRMLVGASIFSPARVRESVASLNALKNNEPYEYEELVEVDEAEYNEILQTKTNGIWRPVPQAAADPRPSRRSIVVHSSTGSAPARAASAVSAASAPDSNASAASPRSGAASGSGVAESRKRRRI